MTSRSTMFTAILALLMFAATIPVSCAWSPRFPLRNTYSVYLERLFGGSNSQADEPRSVPGTKTKGSSSTQLPAQPSTQKIAEDVCENVLCPTGYRCVTKYSQCDTESCPAVAYCDAIAEVTDICRLEVAPGNCSYKYEEWYYNQETHSCQTFMYTGCGGNANRFPTQRACLDSCDKRSVVCRLRQETGPCRAAMRRFYYDVTYGYCRLFIYGGCHSNGNNFETYVECMNACRGF